MKVLHVFKTYLPDSSRGIERVIWEIAENTWGHGVQTEVLSLSRTPEPREVAIGHHLSVRARQDLHLASTGLSLQLFGEFARRAAAADIIHYHFPWPMMDLLQLLRPPRKPTVATYHSDIVRQKLLLRLYGPVMNRFLDSVDHIVVTSPNYGASSNVLQRYATKISVVPIGLTEQPAIDPLSRERLRRLVGERFFLFVGALRYYKGLSVLLEAARITGLPVVIVGSGEGQALIRAAHLPNVRYLGHVSEEEKWALLNLSSAFVFPSHLRSEAFGVALLEAARAGRALISCEIGTGTSYVNENGQTGIVIRPSDPGALAVAMKALNDDASLCRLMGANARKRYERMFTGAKMGASYAELYRSMLEKGPESSAGSSNRARGSGLKRRLFAA